MYTLHNRENKMATAPKNASMFTKLNYSGDNCLHEVVDSENTYHWFPIKVDTYQYEKGKGLAVSPDFNLKAINMTGFKGTTNNWLLMSVVDSVVSANSDDMLCPLEIKVWSEGKYNFKKEETENNLKLWKAKQGKIGNLVCLMIDKEKLPVLNLFAEILADNKIVCRTIGVNPVPFPKNFSNCNLKEEKIREHYNEIIASYRNKGSEETNKQLQTEGSKLSLLKEELLGDKLWFFMLPTPTEVEASIGAIERVERADGLGWETIKRTLPLREDGSVIFTEPVVSDPKSKSGSGYGYGGGSTNNISVIGEITLTEKVKQTTESLSNLVALFNDPHLETLLQLKKVSPDKWKLILELVNGVYIPETTTTFLPDKKVLESLQEENLYQNYPVISPATTEDNGEKKTTLVTPPSSNDMSLPFKNGGAEIPEIQKRIEALKILINMERKNSGKSLLTDEGLTEVFNLHFIDKEEYSKLLFEVYSYTVSTQDKQKYLSRIGVHSQQFFYELQVSMLTTVARDLELAVNTFKYLHQV